MSCFYFIHTTSYLLRAPSSAGTFYSSDGYDIGDQRLFGPHRMPFRMRRRRYACSGFKHVNYRISPECCLFGWLPGCWCWCWCRICCSIAPNRYNDLGDLAFDAPLDGSNNPRIGMSDFKGLAHNSRHVGASNELLVSRADCTVSSLWFEPFFLKNKPQSHLDFGLENYELLYSTVYVTLFFKY